MRQPGFLRTFLISKRFGHMRLKVYLRIWFVWRSWFKEVLRTDFFGFRVIHGRNSFLVDRHRFYFVFYQDTFIYLQSANIINFTFTVLCVSRTTVLQIRVAPSYCDCSSIAFLLYQIHYCCIISMWYFCVNPSVLQFSSLQFISARALPRLALDFPEGSALVQRWKLQPVIANFCNPNHAKLKHQTLVHSATYWLY